MQRKKNHKYQLFIFHNVSLALLSSDKNGTWTIFRAELVRRWESLRRIILYDGLNRTVIVLRDSSFPPFLKIVLFLFL